ncbi:MAG: hypothetical protein JSW25_04610 [Thermoplasmata archaeon]|nr:MAG: hypothetical protein JSW25_04610 [Thermoplasmata archaeon]
MVYVCLAWTIIGFLAFFIIVGIWIITRPLEEGINEGEAVEGEGGVLGAAVELGLEVAFWTLLGL